MLHSIGNLTLLTDKLNPALSNGAWSTKRPKILEYSKLNMNRYFQEKDVWNEAEIFKRSHLLYELAKKVWPHPGKAAANMTAVGPAK